MNDQTPDSLIPYDEIVQEALRAVVGRVLGQVERDGGLPGDVVGLGSTVEITDLDAGSRMRFTLVVPERATGNGRVSVLSPLGMALFGYRMGDTIEWGPVSRLLRYRIDDVRRNGRARNGQPARQGGLT